MNKKTIHNKGGFMKTQKIMKKLTLHKQTLANLAAGELDDVMGGTNYTNGATCASNSYRGCKIQVDTCCYHCTYPGCIP
jgi:hypothetical protein